ncbi:serine/threonine-protein kinase [Paenibacillus shirakamiensis]|uniref:Serine/threonine-protein kinase n=1 Tax=Paenibacillus shirakamiensis TaxID=1265935 RepID=A0ABS4JFL6_9BACL|nr:serine/threonine-protein kinase [Paenibacillus shirakamiensis]MBP1999921.1 serine/threonine-protein kinase [Paenibacillus shirakamiensis]
MSQDTYMVHLDRVSFELQEPHDFSWIKPFGTVVNVFDQQDSGNICFGVEKDGKKKFIKYAGSRPMEYKGEPRDAIDTLYKAVPLYEVLEHPALIRLVEHFKTADGYAAIFDWVDGECLHSHWLFAGAEKLAHPNSPFYKFRQLSIGQRLNSLDVIYDFHRFVESKGYVAVDFYDGSILYDFSTNVTKVCDIDFYRLGPSVNDSGEQFWGTTRLKSPEEFTLDAPIDPITNVFTMGAIAFTLLGGELDRSFSKWEASSSLYEVALRAVSQEREQRYDSIYAFKKAWDEAKSGRS